MKDIALTKFLNSKFFSIVVPFFVSFHPLTSLTYSFVAIPLIRSFLFLSSHGLQFVLALFFFICLSVMRSVSANSRESLPGKSCLGERLLVCDALFNCSHSLVEEHSGGKEKNDGEREYRRAHFRIDRSY